MTNPGDEGTVEVSTYDVTEAVRVLAQYFEPREIRMAAWDLDPPHIEGEMELPLFEDRQLRLVD